MKVCPFVLFLICVLFLATISGASEYPQEIPYSTKAEVQKNYIQLTKEISDLRKSFTRSWLIGMNAYLPFLSLLVTIGLAVIGVVGYVSITRIQEYAKQAEDHAVEIKNFASLAEDSAQQAGYFSTQMENTLNQAKDTIAELEKIKEDALERETIYNPPS